MSERDQPRGPGFEIPDLELEPAVSKRPAPVSSAGAAVSAKPAAPQLGEISLDQSDDDDFELIATGSPVDLAPTAAPTPERRVASAAWPSGRTRSVEQLTIDPAEVALVADYGKPPQNTILTPVYAYRVYARRAPLKKLMAELGLALAEAELLRDTELAQLALGLRPTLEANDAFRRLLQPMRDVDRLAGERSAALSEADSGFKQQMAEFDGELAKLREAEAKAQAVSVEKAAAKGGTESLLRRAEAKEQRVQIEIRGVMDQARQLLGPAGGDLPPAQAAKLEELQARSTALEPELSQAVAAHAAATAALDAVDGELRQLRTQIRQAERQKAAAAGSLQKQLSERAAGVSDAEKQRRDALAEVARAVLAARGGVAVPEATLDALRRHDKSIEALAVRLETHVRALDSHDRARVKQGVILVLSAVSVVLLSILLKAML